MIEAAEEEKLKVKPNKQKNKFIYPFKQTTESFPYCRKKISSLQEKRRKIFPIHEHSRAEDCNGENFNLPRDAAPSSRFNFSHLVPRKSTA